MVILLIGPDTYRMHERMTFLRSAFVQKFASAHPRTVSFSGSDITVDAFHSATHSVGLFTQKTFVTLTHAEDVAADKRDHMEQSLRSVPEDVVVVVSYTAPKKSPWKMLKECTTKVEEFAELEDSEMRTWALQYAKKQNVALSMPEAMRILQSTEKNLWEVAHVIHQLKHIPSTQRASWLPLLVPSVETDTVFTLLDGISEKNLPKSLKALDTQLSQDSSVHGLITLIAKHVGLLYHVLATPNAKTDAHPFAIKKAQVAAKRFSKEQLRTVLSQLLEIDQQLKSSTVDEKAVMTIFLMKACA